MKKIIILACFSLLWFGACKKGDDMMTITGPGINLTADVNLNQAICVSVPIQIKVDLRTKADVGIEGFTIVKNNSETLVDETSVIPNLLLYTFNYAATQADLQAGTVTFVFTLTDKEGMLATETLELSVVNEFAFLQEMVVPDPSWDLVTNKSLSETEGSNVDIFLTVDVDFCGFNCFYYRYTFESKNETRFYPLPYNIPTSPYKNDLKQADLLKEIEGVTPVQKLIVYSSFPDEVSSTGELRNTPLIAQIRGTEEYALIEKGVVEGEFLYRKRSADAGQ